MVNINDAGQTVKELQVLEQQTSLENSRVVKKLLEVPNNSAVWNHCFIHRGALVSREMPQNLTGVLKNAVKVISFIQAHYTATFSKRFVQRLEVIIPPLLHHTKVRWLSQRKILSRVYELKEETHIFLTEKQSHLASGFEDDI